MIGEKPLTMVRGKGADGSRVKLGWCPGRGRVPLFEPRCHIIEILATHAVRHHEILGNVNTVLLWWCM
jgi:hypothetical protein